MPSKYSAPQKSSTEQAIPATHPVLRKKLPLILFGTVFVVIALIGVLFMVTGSKEISRGPQLLIGRTPFIQACSVIDPQLVAKELDINPNMKQQLIESSYAFDPTNTTTGQVELLALSGQDSIESTCKLRFDRSYQAGENGKRVPTYFTVSMYIQQFRDASAAKSAYDESKTRAKTSEPNLGGLSSHTDSFYRAPTSEKGFQPVVLQDNMIIYYVVMLGQDEKGEKIAARVDVINQDVLRDIKAKKGEKIKNFSAVTQLQDNSFIDTCQSTDLQRLGTVLDKTIEYNPISFATSQNFGGLEKEGEAPEFLMSACSFNFRTAADITAQQKAESDSKSEKLRFADKYPHYVLLQTLTTNSKEDATAIVKNFKKSSVDYKASPGEAAPKVEDVKLGDMAIKIRSAPTKESPSEGFFYYIAKGPYAYVIAINFSHQTTPYKAVAAEVTDKQMAQIFNEIVKGTERGSKAVYKN